MWGYHVSHRPSQSHSHVFTLMYSLPHSLFCHSRQSSELKLQKAVFQPPSAGETKLPIKQPCSSYPHNTHICQSSEKSPRTATFSAALRKKSRAANQAAPLFLFPHARSRQSSEKILQRTAKAVLCSTSARSWTTTTQARHTTRFVQLQLVQPSCTSVSRLNSTSSTYQTNHMVIAGENFDADLALPNIDFGVYVSTFELGI